MANRLVKWVLGGVATLVLAGAAAVVVPTWLTLSGEPVSSLQVADDAQTRYPIVLAHGVMGFGYAGKQSECHASNTACPPGGVGFGYAVLVCVATGVASARLPCPCGF